MANLRDYQVALIKQVRNLLKNHKSVLIQGSTGMGKTVLSSFMLKGLADQNKNGFFICHRRELIKQTDESFNEFGIDHAIISSGYKLDIQKPIQICSIGSLINRLQLLPKPDFIIWDECHHVASASWKKIFDYFPEAHHIGLTATPQRLDGRSLGKFFEIMVQAPSMRELINQEYLSDFDMYAPFQPDLSQVETKKGDYDLESLDKIINKPSITGCAIEHYKKICNGKRAIVFCVSINHSKSIVQKFNNEGISAAHIDGSMTIKQRDELIESFRSGDLLILSNVDIVSEGFDLPAIEAAILLRPTQSLGLYLQQVGRALRIKAKKTRAIILDHAGNCLRHGMPDYEYKWNLNDTIKFKSDNANKIKICKSCFLSIPSGRLKCTCGNEDFQFDKRQISEIEGHLILSNKFLSPFDLMKERMYKLYEKDENGCWIWKLRKNGNALQISCKQDGVKITYNPKKLIFEDYTGIKLDKKDTIVNICNNKGCINPAHFKKSTQGQVLKETYKKIGYCPNPRLATIKKHGKNIYYSRATSNLAEARKNKILLESIDGNFSKIFNSQVEVESFLKCSKFIVRNYKDTKKPYKNFLIKSYLPF